MEHNSIAAVATAPQATQIAQPKVDPSTTQLPQPIAQVVPGSALPRQILKQQPQLHAPFPTGNKVDGSSSN